MAVKKLIYKHLNLLGFKKYGHTCVKRIGDTNYYGFVSVERDRHPTFHDMARSIETGWYCFSDCGKTFYDIRCEIAYIYPSLSQQELAENFKNCDVDYSLCGVNSAHKHKFYKSSDEEDERIVKDLLDFFNKMFYKPVYNNKGRSIIAHDDAVSLYTYVKAFYYGSTAEYLFADTLCHMAYDEGKYEDAIYYAKMALVCFRPGQYDYAETLNNFHEVYSTIKLGGWETGADVIEIYENSVRKLYEELLVE